MGGAKQSTSTLLKTAIADLRNRSSLERRSAAKRLRKLSDRKACAPLLDALRAELNDERTWETQYQLIMALGESGCDAALPLIRELADQTFWASMRLTAVGDALVRLGRAFALDASPVFTALDIARHNEAAIADGAMRAVAMLRLNFDESIAERLIQNVEGLGDESVIFWTAAASADGRGHPSAPSWKDVS